MAACTLGLNTNGCRAFAKMLAKARLGNQASWYHTSEVMGVTQGMRSGTCHAQELTNQPHFDLRPARLLSTAVHGHLLLAVPLRPLFPPHRFNALCDNIQYHTMLLQGPFSLPLEHSRRLLTLLAIIWLLQAPHVDNPYDLDQIPQL